MRSSLIVAALSLLSACAVAQSAASASAAMSYSFGLDANSSNLGTYLTVQDGGIKTYNLVDYGSYPYTAATGSGAASTNVDPSTYFDNGTWTGYSATQSQANESGPFGTAVASVGSQETLFLTNTGTDTITIDVLATAQAAAAASVTGASSATNYATVDSYAGIYDFNEATKASSNPLIHLSGSADLGITTSVTSDWTAFQSGGQTYYAGSYAMTLNPGETHILEFYTSGHEATSATTATPAPAAIVPMLVGLVGLIRRRAKA